MNLKGVASGYLYILTNEFPSEQMITITTSPYRPEEFLQKQAERSKNSQWILERPVQVLHNRYLENANLIEGKLHEFLVANGFSGGTPKDYQISYEDALYLLDRVVFEKYLDPGECLEHVTHTGVIPPEGCNYYLLGSLFNGTYGHGQDESYDRLYHKDEGVAFECFKKGAQLDDERCLLELGRCYEYGMGASVDLQKALEYYRAAFAIHPSTGVNALFRLHLKREEPLRAGGVVDTFIDFCEKEAQLPHKSQGARPSGEESVGRVLENHQQFVTILSEFIWDSYQVNGDWELIEGYWDIFEEFSFSICSYLEKQSDMMADSQFPDISKKLERCLQEFRKKAQNGEREETG